MSSKTKLKAIAFLNTNEQNFYRNSYDQFSDGETTFTNTEDYYMRQRKLSAFGKIDLTHDFSKKSTLEATTRFNYVDNKDRSSIDFNSNNLEERLTTTTNFFDSKIVYTTKLSDKKVWIIAGRFINEETPQNYNVNQFVYQDLFDTNAEAIKQQTTNAMTFYGFEAKYLNRKANGHLFEFSTGAEMRNDDLNTRFYLIENQTEIQPDGFQNNLQFQNYSYHAKASYSYQITSNFRMTQSAKINFINQNLQNQNKKFNPLLFSPALNIDWEINHKNKLQASYSYNWRTSGLLNIYPNYIHSGFRNFSTGYDDFTKFANQNVNLMYSLGNWSDRFFMSAMTGYSFSDQYFSSKSTLTQNYSVSEPVVLNNREMIFFNLNADYYLRKIKSNFKVTLGGSTSNYQNFVNESDIRDITSTTTNYGLEVRSGFNGVFNYHLGTKWSYSRFKTSSTFDYTNNRTFLNLNLRFSQKLYVTLYSERYYFGNLSQSKRDFYFSDLNIDFQLTEKLRFNFAINNIFNTDTFVSYSLSDISVSETSYRLIPRYALLKVEWRF